MHASYFESVTMNCLSVVWPLEPAKLPIFISLTITKIRKLISVQINLTRFDGLKNGRQTSGGRDIRRSSVFGILNISREALT